MKKNTKEDASMLRIHYTAGTSALHNTTTVKKPKNFCMFKKLQQIQTKHCCGTTMETRAGTGTSHSEH